MDHTADLGIIVYGKDLKDLFESAALALTHLMTGTPPAPGTGTTRVSVDAGDIEDLMVRWLGEILYLFQGEEKQLSGVDIISVSPVRLDAVLETARFDPEVLEIARDIKAVTYHGIQVARRGRHWEARIILDL